MFGAWLSLVERLVRDQEAGGSNPLAPTNFFNHFRGFPEIKYASAKAGSKRGKIRHWRTVLDAGTHNHLSADG